MTKSSVKKDKTNYILITTNKKASYDYFVLETLEVGIVLKGSEVKSLRSKKATLAESHADFMEDELFIYNLHIEEYSKANIFNHYSRRPKKLLLHKKESKKLFGLVKQKGITLIPIKMYFNHKNIVKLLLATAKGKKKYDKRATIKEREWNIDKARVLKDEN